MSERLIVIGGDAAGMSAASQTRRRRGRQDVRITAFERGSDTSYAACGIPYWVAGTITERDALVVRRPAEFRNAHDIEVHVGHEVVAIDPDARQVTVIGPDQTSRRHDYDQLMIATGAVPIRPAIEGIDSGGVFGVQTLDDGQRVIDALEDRDPATAVVIGAGYIGLEMAEAMIKRGIEVHVVERGLRPMATMDADMGDRIADALRSMGITLHLDTQVLGIEADDDGWVRAVATDDGEVSCQLVILGTGTRPNSDLAVEAGIPVGVRGGIVTDARQRTAVDGVWAAGDCTQVYHRVLRAPTAIALGTIANKQGRIAGINLGGGYARFPGVLGTALTRVCNLEIGRTGLGEHEAREAGFEVVCAVIESSDRAHYYPGGTSMTVKIIAERGTGELLGAQIVGEQQVAARVDVFATALWGGIDVGELQHVDLSYAPPFSPVWDPVLIAARKALDAVEQDRAADR